jgi:cytochrome b involved in lipid metabolism
MMRRIFLISTAAFWIAVGGIWVASLSLPDKSAATDVAAETTYALDEIARHNSAGNCWMVIDGQVYDLSSYAERHPAAPDVFLAWCGKEATTAYRTKTRGRPHSSYADELLATFRIGAASS